ncbi:CCT domain-containing protein [Tanacetum coccineum]
MNKDRQSLLFSLCNYAFECYLFMFSDFLRNGAGFDGRGLSEEDESRINEDVRNIGSVQIHDGLHRQHHQAQGPLVQWERFLPSKSLKVLLVEDDDSTRHVVSALLLTAVANGLEAWKVLIDANKQIDLVLTESSWPKRVVEADSSQATSVREKIPVGHDSAQAARSETTKNHWRSNVARREHVTEDEKLDLEIGCPKSSSLEVEETNKKGIDNSNSKKVSDELDIGMQIGCQNGTPRTEVLGATKISNAHVEALKANHLLSNISIEDYSKKSPTLELSLKRPRDVEDAEANAQERNVLRHSGLSAFSKYNTVSNINQTPTGNVGSCSPLGISSEAAKADNIQSNSNGTPIQRSNGSDDMGSTTNNAFTTKPDDKPLPNNSTVVVHKTHTTLEYSSLFNNLRVIKIRPSGQQGIQVRHHHRSLPSPPHHVRYQSRKKLAEQRPRVRGQFVRHVTNGVNNEDADS